MISTPLSDSMTGDTSPILVASVAVSNAGCVRSGGREGGWEGEESERE